MSEAEDFFSAVFESFGFLDISISMMRLLSTSFACCEVTREFSGDAVVDAAMAASGPPAVSSSFLLSVDRAAEAGSGAAWVCARCSRLDRRPGAAAAPPESFSGRFRLFREDDMETDLSKQWTNNHGYIQQKKR